MANINTSYVRAVLCGSLVAAAAILATVGGAPEAGAVVAPVRAPCATLPGTGPNLSIGDQQNGKTVCITVGEKLLVMLSAPQRTSSLWRPVRVSPPGILTVAPLTSTLSRNITAASFVAAHPGVAELSSQRMACSPPLKSLVMCGALRRWEATVMVVARHKAPVPRYGLPQLS